MARLAQYVAFLIAVTITAETAQATTHVLRGTLNGIITQGRISSYDFSDAANDLSLDLMGKKIRLTIDIQRSGIPHDREAYREADRDGVPVAENMMDTSLGISVEFPDSPPIPFTNLLDYLNVANNPDALNTFYCCSFISYGNSNNSGRILSWHQGIMTNTSGFTDIKLWSGRNNNSLFVGKGSIGFDQFSSYGLFLNANFLITSTEVTDFSVGGVPEPDTWALFLVGFGFVGWRIRRRDTKLMNCGGARADQR